MQSVKLSDLITQEEAEKYTTGQVFYALDFKAEVYVVVSGYVKRYQVTKDNERVIESIYGPGYIFPLSQVYKKLFNFELSQENATYVYEAMTDIEIRGISGDKLVAAVEKDADITRELLYEAGRRLKANINRLASNAIHDDYRKVAHQLVYLAEEFGKTTKNGGNEETRILVPLTPKDMAEQLNISNEVAEAVMGNLEKHGLIKINKSSVFVPDVDLLKDAYLMGVSV